jgi:peptidoglycan/LPS O-acetylase OafA/YrhL
LTEQESSIFPPLAKRLDGVDLLRGLAIFFVLMNHVNMRLRIAKIPYTQGIPEHVVNALFWNGEEGVRIFFAISGFLITSTTVRRWGKLTEVEPRRFYLLRFARIAPLLLLLLATLSSLHLAGFSDFVVKAKTGGLGRALLAALTFHVNVLEANRGYLPGSWDILWSLSVEEIFYLFFPLVCRLFGRGRLLIAVLLVFIVAGPFGRTVLAGHNGTWREYSYVGGMDAIALGCLTAILTAERHYSRRALRGLAAGGLAVMLLCLGCSTEAWKHALEHVGLYMTLLAIGTCMVITAAAQSGWKSPLLLRPLAFVGERSYEVYLTHMFVVFAYFDWFLAAGKPMSAIPWFFVATVLTSALLGAVVARWYSEPLNGLIRRRAFGTTPLEKRRRPELATPQINL